MNISVIIPTYNRAHTLARALKSVMSQKVEGIINIIVIDDGSNDGTGVFVKQHYENVCCLVQSNQGVSAARNYGIEYAISELNSDWVALLDSDDEWLPDKLSLQTALLQQTGLKVCHTEEIWVRNGVRVNQMKKHQKHGGWIFEHCLPLCAMSPSSVLIHRDVFAEVGLFDPSLPACEDYDLWLRISAKYQVAYVNQPCIIKYGGHEDQLSRQFWGMDRFRVIALEKILSTQQLASKQQQQAQKMLVSKLTILLNGAYKHNNHSLIDECSKKLGRWQ